MTTTNTKTFTLHGIECTIEQHVSDYGPDSPDKPIAWVEGTVDAEHDADTSVCVVQLWAKSTSPEDLAVTSTIVHSVLDAAAAVLANHGIL